MSVILLAGAAIALGQSGATLLYSECSESSAVRRVLQNADTVEVRHSVAGGSETCYAVSVKTGNGPAIDGFLLGTTHPAVKHFERQEEVYIAQALTPPQARNNATKPTAHHKRATRKTWNPFATR